MKKCIFFFCIALIHHIFIHCVQQDVSADTFELYQIGMKIWKNECNQQIEGLSSWNIGEDFASMGIGHFIWYPEGKREVFKQTFPQLLKFMEQHGKKIPPGIVNASYACPWKTREEFIKNQSSERMNNLRTFLVSTIDLQIKFMLQRINAALKLMVEGLTLNQQKHIKNQFYRLNNNKRGKYALIDYINFKGEGLLPQQDYAGYRWGLLQVLQTMKGSESGDKAVQEFVQSAQKILTGRVEHAPENRKEQEKKWLIGWNKRLQTYLL